MRMGIRNHRQEGGTATSIILGRGRGREASCNKVAQEGTRLLKRGGGKYSRLPPEKGEGGGQLPGLLR